MHPLQCRGGCIVQALLSSLRVAAEPYFIFDDKLTDKLFSVNRKVQSIPPLKLSWHGASEKLTSPLICSSDLSAFAALT